MIIDGIKDLMYNCRRGVDFMSEIISNDIFNNEEESVISKPKSNIGLIFAKIGIAFLSVIICLSIALIGFSAVVCYGPSSEFKTKFVQKVSENSTTKILADMFLSDAEIFEITNS